MFLKINFLKASKILINEYFIRLKLYIRILVMKETRKRLKEDFEMIKKNFLKIFYKNGKITYSSNLIQNSK